MPIPTITTTQSALSTLAGTRFYVTKTLASTAITTTGVDVTGTASGGALYVNNLIVQTDATGLAGGTNLQVVTDNASGLLVFFSSAISGLGANKTLDLDTGATAKQRFVLEAGKKLTAKATVTDCTGTGNVTVYIEFVRLAANTTIAAA